VKCNNPLLEIPVPFPNSLFAIGKGAEEMPLTVAGIDRRHKQPCGSYGAPLSGRME